MYRNQSIPANQRAGVLAISLAFILSGATVASWFARIPAIKARFDLSDGAMGLLLLCFALGAVSAMPLTGGILARFGGRRVLLVTELFLCVAIALPGMASDLPLLGIALLLLGAGHGCLDVAMNSLATTLEQTASRPIMSILHALFSIGGLLGAGFGALMAWAGVPVQWHLLGVAAVFALLLLGAYPGVPHDTAPNGLPVSEETPPMLVLPDRRLLGLAAVAFCALMVEGVTNDWSALFMSQTLHTSDGFAPLGYAVFSVTMIGGRLIGGELSARFGTERFIGSCGFVTTLGAALCVLAPNGGTALVGFAILGAGLSAMFPLLVSVAGRRPDHSAGVAIAAISTAGYTGLLAGPVVIGALAALLDLRLAMLTLVGLGLLVIWLCGRRRVIANAMS